METRGNMFYNLWRVRDYFRNALYMIKRSHKLCNTRTKASYWIMFKAFLSIIIYDDFIVTCNRGNDFAYPVFKKLYIFTWTFMSNFFIILQKKSIFLLASQMKSSWNSKLMRKAHPRDSTQNIAKFHAGVTLGNKGRQAGYLQMCLTGQLMDKLLKSNYCYNSCHYHHHLHL